MLNFRLQEIRRGRLGLSESANPARCRISSGLGKGPMEPTEVLTTRERQTIVAALRLWQNELGFHPFEELREHYDLGDDPLELDEIESLILRLTGSGR